ncbi:MAG TPA: glucose-6-phosphate dehydrogenase, partial [Polyangia bacterium]
MNEMANPLREGLQGERIPPPTTMVIFGASGDLTKRKLVPALYSLARDRLLPPVFNVVGVARRNMEHGVFRNAMKEATNKYARRRPVEDELWQSFADGIFYVNGTFEDPATYERLKKALADIDRDRDTGGNRVFYLSTPPSEYPIIVKQLGAAGLINQEKSGPFTRVIIEKPFGRDLESAISLNKEVHAVLREDQTYRIDHYLGKETVQNILAFRFANGIWEPLWNGRYIDHVQLTVAEAIGVVGRGGYFEQAGIVRDLVQNHMFQFLCLSAMEPPVAFEAEAVRDEKLKVLRALRPLPTDPEEVNKVVVRGQYGPGFVNGQEV